MVFATDHYFAKRERAGDPRRLLLEGEKNASPSRRTGKPDAACKLSIGIRGRFTGARAPAPKTDLGQLAAPGVQR